MSTYLKTTITAIVLLFMVVSCGGGGSSSVDSALAQIEKAMDKVEKNKTSMTEADWNALSAELEQPAKILSDALDNDQIGAIKKIKISAVMLRYAMVAGEAALHTFVEPLKDSITVISEQLQEAIDSDEMKQAIEEIQKAAKELEQKMK